MRQFCAKYHSIFSTASAKFRDGANPVRAPTVIVNRTSSNFAGLRRTTTELLGERLNLTKSVRCPRRFDLS